MRDPWARLKKYKKELRREVGRLDKRQACNVLLFILDELDEIPIKYLGIFTRALRRASDK